MRSFRMLAFGALAAMALVTAGCASLASIGSTSPAEARTVLAAEQAYTVAAGLETAWLESGVATKAQARVAKAMEGALYANIVTAREAVAAGDSATVAVALKLFNQALPEFTGYIARMRGGP